MTLDEAIRCEEKIVDGYERIQKVKAITEYELLHANNHSQILEWLKELKQLREQVSSSEKLNKWIPVSERLPELNRPLLVTAYHRVYYGHLISESGNYGYPIFRIHGLGDKNRDWVQETMSHEPYSLGRIDAWMYFDIPEPYKASPTGAERNDK